MLLDYAIAMLFKKKIPYFNIFYVQNLLLSLCSQFLECETKICQFFSEFCHFLHFFHLEITILVPEKKS